MPDFPAAVPDLPDAAVSETLFTMHTNIGHVPATNRILLNLRALAGKLGIGLSSPSSPGVLRQSGVAGSTAWGLVQPGDISPGTGNANRSLLVNPSGSAVAYAAVPSGGLTGPGVGSPNTVARTTDGTNVVYGKVTGNDIQDGTILPADMQAGGSGNTFLHTSAGGVVAWTQIAAADVPANALNASSIFAGGTGNRVLRTNDGTNALWGQVIAADVNPGGVVNSVLKTINGAVAGFGSIATLDITPNAISQFTYGNILAGGTYVNSSGSVVMSTPCQLSTTGGPVLVLAYLTVYETTAGGIGQIFSTSVTLDGAGLSYNQSVTAPGVSYSVPIAIMTVASPSGTPAAPVLHTFGLSVAVTNNFVWTISAGQIFAIELKR